MKIWNLSVGIGARSIDSADAVTETYVPPRGEIVVVVTDTGTVVIAGDGSKTIAQLFALTSLGSVTYPYDEDSTISVGGIPVGYDLYNKQLADLWQKMLVVYQNVSISSLSHNIGTLEVGYPVSGNKNISFSIANAGNLAAGNSATLYSSPALFSAFSFNPSTSPQVVAFNGYVFNAVASATITMQVTGQQAEVASRNTNVNWYAPIYYGSTALTSITTEAQIKALAVKTLKGSAPGTYSFTGGRSCICIPTLLAEPPLPNFIDNDTGLVYAFDKLSNVTLNNGAINLTMRVYLSNFINGPTTLKII